MKIESTVETRTKRTIELNHNAILDLLKEKRVIDKGFKGNIKVYVEVPAGGDYSGTVLDIDDGTTVKVEIETVKQEKV